MNAWIAFILSLLLGGFVGGVIEISQPEEKRKITYSLGGASLFFCGFWLGYAVSGKDGSEGASTSRGQKQGTDWSEELPLFEIVYPAKVIDNDKDGVQIDIGGSYTKSLPPDLDKKDYGFWLLMGEGVTLRRGCFSAKLKITDPSVKHWVCENFFVQESTGEDSFKTFMNISTIDGYRDLRFTGVVVFAEPEAHSRLSIASSRKVLVEDISSGIIEVSSRKEFLLRSRLESNDQPD
ncbi:MAG: hypothetical protein ACFB9N_04970 [Geitlerinemataceae cyanobacterium]